MVSKPQENQQSDFRARNSVGEVLTNPERPKIGVTVAYDAQNGEYLIDFEGLQNEQELNDLDSSFRRNIFGTHFTNRPSDSRIVLPLDRRDDFTVLEALRDVRYDWRYHDSDIKLDIPKEVSDI